MNSVREYRMPLLIGGGALVVALLIWVAVVAPQNSKLASLQTKQTQLTSQQSALEAKLASLKSEKQRLSSSCADLQKIATQIPTVQAPTDVDAEESSFESQFNALTAAAGVTLTQFSGFAPATTTGGTSTPTTTLPSGSRASASTTPSDVTAVPTTLTVTGNYSQISAFINGLDGFPRLFVITNFILSYGASTAASGSSGAASSGTASPAAAANPNGPPLWTGATPTAPSAGPYSVAITGSIFYTSTPNALEACTKATATLK
jgi:Tfp pilus assembly protein PilO